MTADWLFTSWSQAGLVALSAFAVLARLRRRTGFQQFVDNQPALLMRDGRFLDDAMRSCRITQSDVIAKLREANVLALDQVRAVVLETTGDISVLHGSGTVDDALLDNVRQHFDDDAPPAGVGNRNGNRNRDQG